MIKVVIIGAGGVSWSLIRGIESSCELSLEGVVVRSPRSAEFVGCGEGVVISTLEQKLPVADIYIMAVSDSVISQVSAALKFPKGAVVAHTAGGVDLLAISEEIEHRAVFYPMQSFTKEYDVDWSQVPVFIEGATSYALKLVESVARALSQSVYPLTSIERERLHIAAVFGCNFTNALIGIAAEHLSKIGLPLDVLAPLVNHTVAKAIASGEPSVVQSGPACRGDVATQQSHLSLIEDKEQRDIYKLISSMIWRISKRS